MSNEITIPKDIVNTLKKFDAESQSINDTIANKLIAKESIRINDDIIKKLISNDEPSIIYHYTNDNGLKGILEGKLWLTDIFDLNDPSELKLGLKYFVKALENKIFDGYPEGKRLAECFKILGYKEIIEKTAHYFVLSFSKFPDDLGQWRAYANNGCGFAIGFDRKIIEGAFQKEDESDNYEYSTFPVTYNDSLLTKIQNELVEKLYHDILLKYPNLLDNDTLLKEICFILFTRILYINLFFKHQAYYSEQEYRFLQIHSADPLPNVKFRSHPYSLIKYREFDWLNLASKALKEIVIGPSEDNQQKAHQFAKDCLQAAGIDSVKLILSNIPYRGI
jgi:hypothetical protein